MTGVAPQSIDGILPHLDRELLIGRLRAAGGNEIDSGKLLSLESSAALAVNFFGWFCTHPQSFPGFPGVLGVDAPTSVEVERTLRFPWRGGRHPWLDAVIETPNILVSVESKRYEPFRKKKAGSLSEAYRRNVWGDNMRRFEAMRDALSDGKESFERLDAVQLVKHAFGVRTVASRSKKRAVLVYLFAEPARWPDGRAIEAEAIAIHRVEIERFSRLIAGDEVEFVAVTYAQMLKLLSESADEGMRHHATCIEEAFAPL